MKYLSLLIWFFTCIACSSQESEVVFKGANVIPMDKERVLRNQDVVTKNGIIITIVDHGKVKYDKNALVIDAGGKYLIPGLTEMHAHVPPVDDLEPMKEVLMLFLCNGITTIRGMLGHPRHLELRTKLQNGEITGPHFITSGPSLNGNTVKSPDAGAEMVRQQKQAGYDFLKLHPGLTKENFAAIAKTAHEVNIPFAGHVSYNVGVWRAIEAGYGTIDHLDGFVESLVPGIESISEQEVGTFGMFIAGLADTARIEKLMKSLREKNIGVVPTQALAERWFAPSPDAETLANEPEMKYMSQETIKNWVNNKKSIVANLKYKPGDMENYTRLRRKLIYECQRYGVMLLSGSDAPQVFNVPGFSLHHELRYMVNSGLTPFEALESSTVNVATYFSRKDMGKIMPGYVSDLVLLDGNPLENIDNTKKIAGVLLGKKWYSKEYINTELKKLEKPKSF